MPSAAGNFKGISHRVINNLIQSSKSLCIVERLLQKIKETAAVWLIRSMIKNWVIFACYSRIARAQLKSNIKALIFLNSHIYLKYSWWEHFKLGNPGSIKVCNSPYWDKRWITHWKSIWQNVLRNRLVRTYRFMLLTFVRRKQLKNLCQKPGHSHCPMEQ